MKRVVIYFFAALVFCLSCQKIPAHSHFRILELEFPWALTSQTQILEQFLRQADKIEVRLYQKGQQVWFGASEFEHLNELVIPNVAEEGGRGSLEITLWDRLENGELRERPALGAFVNLSDKEEGTPLRVGLSLRIPIEELIN